MWDNTRRQFLKGCVTTVGAGGVVAGSSGAASASNAAGETPSHPPEAASGWSAYRGGYGNTAAVGFDHGFGSGFDYGSLETDWTADASGLPVVNDTTVYLPVEGSVHAYNAADGSLEWRSEDVGASKQPTVAYGTVYVGGDGSIAALDPTSGTVRWRTALSDGTTGGDGTSVSSPTVAFGHVYAYVDETLYAVDRETGRNEWHRSSVTVTLERPGQEQSEVERALDGEAVANDERVFTIAKSGTIVGLDPQTGTQQLTVDTHYYHLRDLTVTDERLFVRTDSEMVAAYDASTGERDEEWSGCIRRLAVREGTLVFVTRYQLVAIDLERGEQRWSVGKYSHSIGDPVIACNSVLVSFGVQGGRYENSLVAFDLEDGSEQWTFSRSENAAVGERCVVADQTIYIDDGGLTAIRRTDGERTDGGGKDGGSATDRCDNGRDTERRDERDNERRNERDRDRERRDERDNRPGNGSGIGRWNRRDDERNDWPRNCAVLLRRLLSLTG